MKEKPKFFSVWQKEKKWLVSKFTLLFVVFGLISAHTSASVQPEQKTSIEMRGAYLKDVLWALEQQTSFTFLYNQEDLDKVGKVDVVMINTSVGEILSTLLKGTGLTYSVQNGVVILKREVQRPDQSRMVEISGRVTDEQKVPLLGVTVGVKGTSVGVITDVNGNYKIVLNSMNNIVLVFSYVGMHTQEVVYTGQHPTDVVMKEAVIEIDEVVVYTGYERVNPRETTSAIQSIKVKDIVVPGIATIDQMLEGHVAGMTFMQNSGQVGVTPKLRIRGTSTVLGSQEPVWVINGIVQDNPVDIDPAQINDLDFVNLLGNAISGLNPDDIEQIDILKDASATALYGARAANGVIVVTTKKGSQGPLSLSYSLSGTFMSRPHYSDASVNMMNSRERVDFSRELLEKRVMYPQVENWLGYEKSVMDYWQGKITYSEMQRQVGYYESINTDWFDILMQNTLSTKHTVSLSGGNSDIRYYASVGASNANGSIRGEENKTYTAALNLSGNYKDLSFQFNMNANTGQKSYTPQDVKVTQYAYETTRALPAQNEDGSLWYYPMKVENRLYSDYNIINEKNNSSQDVRSMGITATMGLDYRISEYLKATATASYTANNTTQEIWHGENSFYAAKLRLPPAIGGGGLEDRNVMPLGDEFIYSNTEHSAYTGRAQLNFHKAIDDAKRHVLSASIGGEVYSTKYYGLNQTFRGYLKERGRKMTQVDPVEYPAFALWQTTDENALGIWTDKLTNTVSGYATVSYVLANKYTFNANMRFDKSNRFGSRANEKFTPIWSLSTRWDIKRDLLADVDLINNLALKGSFGYQGNMPEQVSSRMILQRGNMDADFVDYESTVLSYANPNLRWERTSSYNVDVDFSLFRRRLEGNVSYFYKKTHDAIINKSISAINGVGDWAVNAGVLENHGVEVALRITLIDTRWEKPDGFRWSMNTSFGRVTNNVAGDYTDKSLTNQIDYNGYLNGTVPIQGRAMNSFYSYRYRGLNPLNGLPVLYGSDQEVYINNQRIDLLEKYRNMGISDIYSDVMVYSGTRVPTIQGGIQHSFAWGRFSMSINTTYSLGSKIRLLRMYSNVNSEAGTIAPQPTANVRREFINRWRNPGDELYTNIPGVVSGSEFLNSMDGRMWWGEEQNANGENIKFADNVWTMYDKSDLRVVSGNYVKIQSLSVRYNFPDQLSKKLGIKAAYVGVSGTNLYTFCNKNLKGQDPATQDGTAPSINMSLRPTYSLSLNVSF